METRTILIANSKTQSRYSIQTAAETLGELKAQLTQQGIDYSGMTFTEGITKTAMVDDSSVLPTNVMYKGARTNNLVMLLTNPQKRVASGAAIDRKTAYALVKELNLADTILRGEGTNYTRVKTDVLENYINGVCNDAQNRADETLNDVRKELSNLNTASESNIVKVPEAPHANTVNWLYDGVKTMVAENVLYTNDVVVLASLFDELAARLKEGEPKITEDDVNDIMNDLLA